MKQYDISQEVFSCAVFPGDPAPERKILCSMEQGDPYNLTEFSMCAHNGTHVDAPAHFFAEGKTVDQLELEKTTGPAFVSSHQGILAGADAMAILSEASAADPEAAKRILIRGDAVLSEEGARVFAEAGIHLFGNESQTVGPEDGPMAVHKILLGAEVVLLEGIRLAEVPDGVYFLNCAPLNLGGAEGAPCRAVLSEIRWNGGTGFPALTRKKKEISREECLELLIRETRGILSVNGADGYPYGMPMNHYYRPEDGCLYFHCGRGGHRAEALLRSDKVSFCVCEQGIRPEGEWAYTVRSVIVFGRMEVLDDPEQTVAIVSELSRKFTRDEEYIAEEIRRFAKGTLLLKLTPEHICGKRVTES